MPPPPKDKEEENSNNGEVVLQFNSPRETLGVIARATAPELSLVFCLGFAAVAYFHESHFAHVSILLGVWLAVQLAFNVLDNDDFKSDMFWSVFSLLGNVLFYLFLGYCWSMVKLYLDVWQGHLDPALINRIRTCVGTDETGCVIPLLLEMKWMIVRWMTTWPVSLAYTLSRDPLHIVTELIYTWSRQRYFAIMASAIKAHDLASSSSETPETSWAAVLVWFAYVFGYFVIGYAWTHAKLFIDVWQGALPASLDARVRDVYERKASYWEFVKQIKWLVTQWMLTWPLSIVYTLLRHPLRIVVDFIYELSQRKYAWIIGKAMETRMKKE